MTTTRTPAAWSAKPSPLMVRILSGSVFIAIVIAAAFSGTIGVYLLVVALAGLALWEFRDLSDKMGAFLGPLTGKEGRQNMLDFFGDMDKAARAVFPAFGWLGDRIVDMVRGFGVMSDLANIATTGTTNGPASKLTRDLMLNMVGSPPPPPAQIDPLDKILGANRPTGDADMQRALRKMMLTGRDSGPSRTPVTVNVNVDASGGKDPNQIAKAIKDAVPAAIADAFDQIAVEQGQQ